MSLAPTRESTPSARTLSSISARERCHPRQPPSAKHYSKDAANCLEHYQASCTQLSVSRNHACAFWGVIFCKASAMACWRASFVRGFAERISCLSLPRLSRWDSGRANKAGDRAALLRLPRFSRGRLAPYVNSSYPSPRHRLDAAPDTECDPDSQEDVGIGGCFNGHGGEHAACAHAP